MNSAKKKTKQKTIKILIKYSTPIIYTNTTSKECGLP